MTLVKNDSDKRDFLESSRSFVKLSTEELFTKTFRYPFD